MGRSRESCVKKYRSWRSERDCQPGGRDKLKNASILRKYGSIGMGEKTSYFLLTILLDINNLLSVLTACSIEAFFFILSQKIKFT